MKSEQQAHAHERRTQRTGHAAVISAFLAVWGADWVVNALVDFASFWVELEWLKQAALALAAVVSLVLLGGSLRKYGAAGLRSALPLVLPFLLIIGGVLLLEYVHAVDAFFVPLLRGIVVAVCFVQLGIGGLGRKLIYLGLWLFAAVVVLGLWYLGYAPVVLDGLGGLALLAGGWLVQAERRF
jgi:hypothetical protein